MDEVRNKLTKQEQALLSDLYEDRDTMRALLMALSHRQFGITNAAIAGATNWDQILLQRGELAGLNWVGKFLKDNFKATQKAREQRNVK